MTIAIIKAGGKQYKVTEGQELKVELLPDEVGKTITLEALLVSDESGESVEVGNPTVSGKTVEAEVLEHGRGKKVTVVKFKAKTRYRRKVGHRQPFTKLKITSIK